MLAEWVMLVEGLAVQRSLEQVADRLLDAFATKATRVVKERLENGWPLDPEDMGGVAMDDAYPIPKRKPMQKLSPDIAEFVRAVRKGHLRHIRLFFSHHSPIPGRRVGGWYNPNPPREIGIIISPVDFEQIKHWAAKSSYGVHAIRDILGKFRSILVHELRHAYEDWASGGKYRLNPRTQEAEEAERARRRNLHNQELATKAHELYLNDPKEISARYSDTVEALDRKAHDAKDNWRHYLQAFKFGFDGWRKLPAQDQTRLIKRLAAHWQAQNVTYHRDPTPAIDALADRIRASGSKVLVYGSKDYIRVERLSAKRPEEIAAVLKPVLALADVYGLKVCLDDKLPPSMVRPLGFVNQYPRSVNGGKRDYSLPLGVVYFRRPVNRRAKAA